MAFQFSGEYRANFEISHIFDSFWAVLAVKKQQKNTQLWFLKTLPRVNTL